MPDDDNEENSISDEILALLNESDFDESVNDVVSPELGHPNHDIIPKKSKYNVLKKYLFFLGGMSCAFVIPLHMTLVFY